MTVIQDGKTYNITGARITITGPNRHACNVVDVACLAEAFSLREGESVQIEYIGTEVLQPSKT